MTFTILVIGLSGIIAQTLVLRELLVSFNGNELTLGIILANWLIAEALGSVFLGKISDRAKNKIRVFILLEAVFAIALPLCIYLARIPKNIAGIPFNETMGLPAIFITSLVINFPLGFCHGALFSAACRIYPAPINKPAIAIGRVYALETTGTILGGIILTCLFIPYLNSFQVAFILSVLNTAIIFFFWRHTLNKQILYVAFLLSALFLFLNGLPDQLNRISIAKQWGSYRVLAYRNSVYGNIAVTKRQEQYTFFHNGIPIITTPYPDITFSEEFGNLPLLFHPSPKAISIISSGAGGLINEVLKHPVEKLDYAELDPMLIKILRDYPSSLTTHELDDKRVNIINSDGRFFLKNTFEKYDVILLGISYPSDLATNRLFTREFFLLAKNKLTERGLLTFWLPGSLTYLSKELRDLNICILNSLKQAYSYTRVIPGDINIFLASDSDYILKVDSGLIAQRMSKRYIKTKMLNPGYLEYRLNKNWEEWFSRSVAGATKKANLDLMPVAVFQMLLSWNKQFSWGLSQFLQRMQGLNFRHLILLITFIVAALAILSRHQKSRNPKIIYAIVTSGFFGMSINLILIFSFQAFYGYLYYMLGLLISIFMAGIGIGSTLMTLRLEKIKNHYNLLVKSEAAALVLPLILAAILSHFSRQMQASSLIFAILFFMPGFILGLQFPLANRIYLKHGAGLGQTVGILYCSDLVGGWLAAISAGVIFLPVLGLYGSCAALAMLKLSSMFLLLMPPKKF